MCLGLAEAIEVATAFKGALTGRDAEHRALSGMYQETGEDSFDGSVA